MLRHSRSRSVLTKNNRRNRGRKTSTVLSAEYVATMCRGYSSGANRLRNARKVADRISMSCIGDEEMPLLSLWSTACGCLETLSSQLEVSCVHGDPSGRNSSSLVLRSSQWTQLSIKLVGKSSRSMGRGTSCNFLASLLACKIRSPSFHESRIFGRLNHYHHNTPKNGALPGIRTRRTESYTPFQEHPQESHRKFSERASGKDGNKRRIWL